MNSEIKFRASWFRERELRNDSGQWLLKMRDILVQEQYEVEG